MKDTKHYRDDGVILLCKTSPEIIDRLRKESMKSFEDHEINIATTTYVKVIIFLDVTLDLTYGHYIIIDKSVQNQTTSTKFHII